MSNSTINDKGLSQEAAWVLDTCNQIIRYKHPSAGSSQDEAYWLSFDKRKADHTTCPEWHPNSNDTVQDLVHPSTYPLVYGRIRGFQAERVGVTDAIRHWAGKGNVIPKLEFDFGDNCRIDSVY